MTSDKYNGFEFCNSYVIAIKDKENMKRHLLFLLISLLCCVSTFAQEQTRLQTIKEMLQEDSLRAVNYHDEVIQYYEEKNQLRLQLSEACKELQLGIFSNKMQYVFYTTAMVKQYQQLDARLQAYATPNHLLTDYCHDAFARLSMLRESLDGMVLPDSINGLPNPEIAERAHCQRIISHLESKYHHALVREEETNRRADSLLRTMNHTRAYVEACSQRIRHAAFDNTDNTYWLLLPYVADHFKAISQQEHSGELSSLSQSGELQIIWCEMLAMLLLAIVCIALLMRFMKGGRLLMRIKANPLISVNLLWVLLCAVSLLADIMIFRLPAITNAFSIFAVYLLFCMMVQLFLLLREQGSRASKAIRLYAPILFVGFCTIFIRLFFLPDTVLVLITFPILLVALIWQAVAFLRCRSGVARFDRIFSLIALVCLLFMALQAMAGYVFIALIIFIWMQAEAMCVIAAFGLHKVLQWYSRHYLNARIAEFVSHHENAHFRPVQITWFYDLILMVGLPVFLIASLPLCTYIALDYFHAGEMCIDYFCTNFYSLQSADGEILKLSVRGLCIVGVLFFIFRYVSHLSTAICSQIISEKEQRRGEHIHHGSGKGDKSLVATIIRLTVAALYLASCCIVLAIPTSALTFIFAGLATGIGFAMRDIINNLFYGIQLMAGRLHVGDYIVCGNYRGVVTSISYLTTQMLTEENATVYFTNADLFSNTFQNLTRVSPYETALVTVDIDYGCDIRLAEETLRKAVSSIHKTDRHGREMIAQDDIHIEVNDLNKDAIRMAVRIGVLAEECTYFLPEIRMAIYESLAAAGIQAPTTTVNINR